MDYNKEELNLLLKNGGVIAFVTDTVWGIGCLPDNKKAVERIYEIKGRDLSKPLILMSNESSNLFPYVENVSQIAKTLMQNFWSGALTLVLKKSDLTPDFITSGFDTVGLRVPNNKTFKQICEDIEGHVLATTSANLSGEPSAKTFKEAVSFIGEYVDLVITDDGEIAKGLESTVALVVDDEIKILRQGAVKIS